MIRQPVAWLRFTLEDDVVGVVRLVAAYDLVGKHARVLLGEVLRRVFVVADAQPAWTERPFKAP